MAASSTTSCRSKTSCVTQATMAKATLAKNQQHKRDAQQYRQRQQQQQQERRPQVVCPAPGSLYDILRKNCGESLFVQPILWTDTHTRLLDVRFSTTPFLTEPGKDGDGHQHYSRLMGPLDSDLSSLLCSEDTRPFFKSRAIKTVMSALYPSAKLKAKSAVELDLHFGDRVYRGAVRVPVVWEHGGSSASSFDSEVTRPISSFARSQGSVRSAEASDLSNMSGIGGSQTTGRRGGPLVAYINRTYLSLLRQNLFRVVPGPEGGDRANTPVTQLQRLRSKLLMPRNLDYDPFLAGVFLALAQSCFYDSVPHWGSSQARSKRVSGVPSFEDVNLHILTHNDATHEFLVYRCTVTAQFLQRFAEPTKALGQGAGTAGAGAETLDAMHIDCCKLPVWPVSGLRERLGRVLGEEIVGDLQEHGLFGGVSEATATATATATLADDRFLREGLKRKRGDRQTLSVSLDGTDTSKRRRTKSLSSSLAVF